MRERIGSPIVQDAFHLRRASQITTIASEETQNWLSLNGCIDRFFYGEVAFSPQVHWSRTECQHTSHR